MKKHATAFLEHAMESGLGTAMVMHDRDTKFTQSFDDALKPGIVWIQKAAPCSPNTCAFVERFIQTQQQECLDYFVVFGERHMDHPVSEMVAHYHEERPHQGKDNELLIRGSTKQTKKSESRPIGEIRCRQRLGGLLKHYSWKAA